MIITTLGFEHSGSGATPPAMCDFPSVSNYVDTFQQHPDLSKMDIRRYLDALGSHRWTLEQMYRLCERPKMITVECLPFEAAFRVMFLVEWLDLHPHEEHQVLLRIDENQIQGMLQIFSLTLPYYYVVARERCYVVAKPYLETYGSRLEMICGACNCVLIPVQRTTAMGTTLVRNARHEIQPQNSF